MTDTTSTASKMKILYIAGWGRSGTTILGGVLGQVEGFFHAGEVLYFGERGWRENHLCGCGKPFHECEMWRSVTEHLLRQEGKEAMELLAEIRREGLRTRHLPTLLAPGHLGIPRSRDVPVVRVLTGLYRRIQATTGASWIVDSSKSPAYGRMIELIPHADVYVLHLIRDPRATGYSWRRWTYDPGGRRFADRHGVLKNAAMWTVWNAFIEALWNGRRARGRYFRIRYETFANRPGEAIKAVLGFLGSPEDRVPLSSEGEIDLLPSHTVAGNPVRLKAGKVKITLDDEWKARVKWHDKALVAALTWPLLLRYGYPMWV